MGSPEFGESSGKMLETMLAAQKSVRDNMRTYLETMNVPTREDIARLGELVIGLEEKVDQVVDRLDAIDDAGPGRARRARRAGWDPPGRAGPQDAAGPKGATGAGPRARRARSGPKGADGQGRTQGRDGARPEPPGRAASRGAREARTGARSAKPPRAPDDAHRADRAGPTPRAVWASNDRALDMARAILGSADAPVGLTPKELIWRKNKARLYRYIALRAGHAPDADLPRPAAHQPGIHP